MVKLVVLLTLVSSVQHVLAFGRAIKDGDQPAWIADDVRYGCPSQYQLTPRFATEIDIGDSIKMVFTTGDEFYRLKQDDEGWDKISFETKEHLHNWAQSNVSTAMFVNSTMDGHRARLLIFSTDQGWRHYQDYEYKVCTTDCIAHPEGDFYFASNGLDADLLQIPGFIEDKTRYVSAAVAVPHPVEDGKYQILVVTTGSGEHIHHYDGNFTKIASTGTGPTSVSGAHARRYFGVYKNLNGTDVTGSTATDNVVNYFPSGMSFVEQVDDSNLFRVFWGNFLFKETQLPADKVESINLDLGTDPSEWHWAAERWNCPPHIYFDATMDALTRITYDEPNTRPIKLIFNGDNYWRTDLADFDFTCQLKGTSRNGDMDEGDNNDTSSSQHPACVGLILNQLHEKKIDAAVTLFTPDVLLPVVTTEPLTEEPTPDGPLPPMKEFVGLITGNRMLIVEHKGAKSTLPGEDELIKLSSVTINVGDATSGDASPDPDARAEDDVDAEPDATSEGDGKIDAAFSVWSEGDNANILVIITKGTFVTFKCKLEGATWILSDKSERMNLADNFQGIPDSPDAADFDLQTQTYQFVYGNHYVSIKFEDAEWSPTGVTPIVVDTPPPEVVGPEVVFTQEPEVVVSQEPRDQPELIYNDRYVAAGDQQPFRKKKRNINGNGRRQLVSNDDYDYVEEIEYIDDGSPDIVSLPVEPNSVQIDPLPNPYSGDDIILPPPMLSDVPPGAAGPTIVKPEVAKDGYKREIKLIQGNLFHVEEDFYENLFYGKGAPIATYQDFVDWRLNGLHPELNNQPVVPTPPPVVNTSKKEDGKHKPKWIIPVIIVIAILLLIGLIICIFCFCCKKKKKEDDVVTVNETPSGVSPRDVEKMDSNVVSGIQPTPSSGTKPSTQPSVLPPATKSKVSPTKSTGFSSTKSSGVRSNVIVSPSSAGSGGKKSADSDATFGKSVPAMQVKTKKKSGSKSSSPSSTPKKGRSFGHISPPPSRSAQKIISKVGHSSSKNKSRSVIKSTASTPPSIKSDKGSKTTSVSYPSKKSPSSGSSSPGKVSNSPGV